MHLLFDLGCQAFEERPDLSGCLAVERDGPLTATPTGLADTPGRRSFAAGAEHVATIGKVQLGPELNSNPPADIAVEPHWRHHGERGQDKTGLN